MTSIQLTAKGSPLRDRFNDVMVTRRAYLSSIGTGGALVACAALLFVLASAIVAFNGLPGDGNALSPTSVSAAAGHGPVSAPAATRLAAFAAASAVTGAARSGGRGIGARRVGVGHHGGAATGHRGGPAIGSGGSGGGRGGVSHRAPVVPVAGGSLVGGACCSRGSVVGRVTGTVGHTVQTVTGTAGAAASGAGGAVGGAGSTLGGTVGRVGSGLGGAVGGLGGH